MSNLEEKQPRVSLSGRVGARNHAVHKIRKRLRKLLSQIVIDLGRYRQTVFLAGTGRSGTTWIQDVINYDDSYRVMFEPFDSSKIGLLNGWNYRQYLRSENHDEKFLKPAETILSGKIRHASIDQFNRKVVARKRLIKDIRANLLLKWIKQNFPEIPIVLLLRHPCAVANSKLNLGWGTHLHDFLIQEELMADFLSPFKREMESAQDIFDKHIFMWCIENYVPLKQFVEGDILVMFYENLCHKPQKEIEILQSFIGNNFSPKVLDVSAKGSALSREESPIMSGVDLLSSWRKTISDKQTKRAVEILSLFGLQAIYGEGDFPLLSGKDALRVFSAQQGAS